MKPSYWCYDCEVGSTDDLCWRCGADLTLRVRPKTNKPHDPPPKPTRYSDGKQP